jgi:hypothetical protein
MKIVMMAVIVLVKPKSINESHFFTNVGLEDRFFENLIILCYLIIWDHSAKEAGDDWKV